MKKVKVNIKNQEVDYKEILNNMDIGFYKGKIRGELVQHNSAFNKILGYDPSESLVGVEARQFFLYPEEAKKYYDDLLETDFVKNMVVRIRDVDGNIKSVQLNSRLIRNVTGEPIEIEGTFVDVTEKYDTRQKLNELKELYRLIIKCGKGTVNTLDMNLKFTYNSPEMYDLLGYTPDEMQNTSVFKYTTPDSIKMVEKTLKNELKMEKMKNQSLNRVARFDIQQIHKDGHIVDIEVVATFIRDENGKPNGIFGVSRDITQHKMIENQLKESEAKYRDLYEEAPNAYFSISPNKSIIRVNKAAEKLLGYSREEFLKMKVFDLYTYTENGAKKAKELFNIFLSGHRIKNEELEFKHKNGDKIWIDLSVKALLDEKGKVLELCSMLIDISERKKNEEIIKNLAKFPSENPNPVLRVNKDKILYINESGRKLFDINEKKIIPDILQNAINNINTNISSKYLELKLNSQIYSFNITPIRDEEYINIYGLDITEQKIAEEKLKKSENKYRKAYDSAKFFKELVAHDMNNLLQSILSFVELYKISIEKPGTIKYKRDILSLIIDKVFRGSQIASNAIKLSDIDENNKILHIVDVNKNLMKVIALTDKNYQSRNININTESIEENHFVLANELILDLFENIIMNSVIHNNNPNVEIRVNVSEIELEKKMYCKLEFIDNGVGIPDERKEIIFHQRSRSIKGKGIGLSLVKQIIKIFDGKIWVEDKIEGDFTQGSKFIILIPNAKSASEVLKNSRQNIHFVQL